MTGHVFHPGHQELHGITVVVEAAAGATYVGRFDRQDEAGVHLLDAGIHHPAPGSASKAEYLAQTVKFGIRAERKHVLVPGSEVVQITRLADYPGA